ncbi:MAG: hypothetical protein ACREBU_06665 [Nitrososphaera sp.]
MGASKRFVAILASIAVAAAVSTTLMWAGIIAVAAPTFDNAALAVRRVDGPSLQSDPVEAATFIAVPAAIVESNPKLKEAMEGADRNFEILSNTVGYEIPVDDVYKVSITEGELNTLISSLPEGTAKQAVQDEYVSQYDRFRLEHEGKYYLATITTVGTL